ncbi:MAG: cysteine desulfurase family protein [Anaerovoracaceae bacterium]|nr:cysteine desulfurase family protein [Anaerovoracaceae bacterium]
MNRIVYLDNSATTRQYDQVTDVMAEAMRETYGNPSSLHMLGVEAEKKVRSSRKILASALGASEEEFFFTSGGTESDNTVLFGVAEARKRTGKKIITTAVEHPAILEPAKRLEAMGFTVEYIGVDRNCHLNLDQLASAIDDETILISAMGVNNEAGTILPIGEIAALKDRYNREHKTDILLHSDAVQAFGKVPVDLKGAYKGVDFLSVSGHKIHGPKGIGGLYIRKGIHLPPFMNGGGQERHMRSGTENTPGIIGFGKAAEMGMADFAKRTEAMKRARARLLEGLLAEIPDIRINSPQDETASPSVLNVSFLGTRGEVLLHTLEQEGIFVSTGSACSSNKKGRSHVLTAMGLSDKEIEGAIRFSFSEENTLEEMDYTVEKVKAAVTRFRRLGSFR